MSKVTGDERLRALHNQPGGTFKHRRRPDATQTVIARQILMHAVDDPTRRATHVYTPGVMPRAGEPTRGLDTRSGLGTVPGLTGETYRPSWTANPRSQQVIVPGVEEILFNLYRQPGHGRVH